MKQTSVEWLIKELEEQKLIKLDKLSTILFNKNFATRYELIIEQAKEMEKEQIEDAHIEGQRVFDKHDHTQWTTDQAELYYNERYNK